MAVRARRWVRCGREVRRDLDLGRRESRMAYVIGAKGHTFYLSRAKKRRRSVVKALSGAEEEMML